MTLNHNFGCFSGVGSGIAGNSKIDAQKVLQKHYETFIHRSFYA